MSNLADFKLLILDDDTAFHSLICSAVHDLGLTNIETCTSIKSALAKMAGGFAPNIILMEINLGGMAGLNFMRQIRAGKSSANPNAPIIIMSKALTPKIAYRASDVGFEHFIRKPITVKAVQKRVRAMLDNPRRFVVGKAYFGPDRRDPNASHTYKGEERRRIKVKPGSKITPPARQATTPGQLANGANISDTGKVINDGSADQEKTAEIERAVAPAKERIKTAAKPLPVEPLTAVVEAIEPHKAPHKAPGEIELAEVPDTETNNDQRDRAAEIAAKLEAHAIWLSSHGSAGEKANFADEDLAGTDFAAANLANANLRGADLQDANLFQANLFDADLRRANLSGANLGGADLHNAKIRHANLSAAQLPEAGLGGADLAGANLSGAQLAGADFKGANFLSTNICAADLLGANLTQSQINKANGDQSTKLPPGLRINAES